MRTPFKRCRFCSLEISHSPLKSISVWPDHFPSPAYHGPINSVKPIYRTFATRSVVAFPFNACISPFSISARTFSGKVPVVTQTDTLPSKANEHFENLNRKTKAWLEIPVNTWTPREVSMGRFLIREWSESKNYLTASNDIFFEKRAIQQNEILRRWMRERQVAAGSEEHSQSIFRTQTGKKSNSTDSKEIVEMLNRCLNSWRDVAMVHQLRGGKIGTKTRKKLVPQSESMKLVHLFRDASESLNDKDLSPNQKTFSMCINVLSLRPESSTVCDDILWILKQCQETAKPDLQFFNVCLHALAKSAMHHPNAPILVERIFREMMVTTNLSPNTACFVSVLHAWASSIPGTATGSQKENEATALAADRAEVILDQMIQDYPHLVDTICFNICIDAWGKQGFPEKAEAVLRRLQQYHHNADSGRNDDTSLPRKRMVKPNQISFNSAINAWSKSARMSNRDPQKVADRARQLFQQMKIQGFEPSSETFGSLMEAFSSTHNPGDRVQSFLDEIEMMHSEGKLSLPPPKVCYLMAIRAWGRTKPGGAERADLLVQKMEEQKNGTETELEPCTIIYTALISAWSQSDMESSPDRALQLFHEMRRKAKLGRKNVSPNAITMNTVLNAFCNHDRIDEAREFFAEAKRVIRPDSNSYMTILKAYAKSNTFDAAENAQTFLRELEEDYCRGMGSKPTIRMYSQLFVALGNNRKSDSAFRAEEIFWQLLRQESRICVLPDTTAFNCILRAWSKCSEGGAADRAESFFKKVQEGYSEEISVDPISHLHMIHAWTHSRRRKAPRQAEWHLEQARAICCNKKNSNWRLTRAHFDGTILAWKRSNDSTAASRVQKLQVERDLTTRYNIGKFNA